MSAQSMADAWAPIEAAYHQQVLCETWGHLAPVRNRTYRGRFVYAVGCFGDDDLNPTALSFEFPELDSSPWLYDALGDFMESLPNEVGCVYEWEGTFRNYGFKGVRRLLIDANGKQRTPKREGNLTQSVQDNVTQGEQL